MVLCFSRETSNIKKNARTLVEYTGSNEPSHAPKFECPDNTFNMDYSPGDWNSIQEAEKYN
jgi:hypothetical protein